MISQMITENQRRAVNDRQIHSSMFSLTIAGFAFKELPWCDSGHQNTTKASIFLIIRNLSFEEAKTAHKNHYPLVVRRWHWERERQISPYKHLVPCLSVRVNSQPRKEMRKARLIGQRWFLYIIYF